MTSFPSNFCSKRPALRFLSLYAAGRGLGSLVAQGQYIMLYYIILYHIIYYVTYIYIYIYIHDILIRGARTTIRHLKNRILYLLNKLFPLTLSTFLRGKHISFVESYRQHRSDRKFDHVQSLAWLGPLNLHGGRLLSSFFLLSLKHIVIPLDETPCLVCRSRRTNRQSKSPLEVADCDAGPPARRRGLLERQTSDPSPPPLLVRAPVQTSAEFRTMSHVIITIAIIVVIAINSSDSNINNTHPFRSRETAAFSSNFAF